jgi:dTDP-4-dehydrorhamnose reductase
MEKSSKKPFVVVTGNTGMLANAFTKEARQSYEVLGVSRRPTLGGAVCDLSKEKEIQDFFAAHHPDLIVHAAAFSDVDGCERDPGAAEKSNVDATRLLSKMCELHRIPWIYVSTDYVFDGCKTAPYIEEDREAPVNIYGMTKLAGEWYAKNSKVSSVVVRTSWLFGHGNNPHNFVSAITNLFKNEKRIAVLDDQTDSPTNMKDLSIALINIGNRLMSEQIKKSVSPWHDVFHICNTGPATRLEMTLRMKEWLGLKDVKVDRADRNQVKGRVAIRPKYVVMSTARYEKFSGTKMRPWQESLKEYLNEAVSCAS